MNEPVVRSRQDFIEVSAEIVAAYISHNALSPSDLPKLIVDVHAAFKSLGAPVIVEVAKVQKPAISIRKSITPDFLICLEDGKPFKSLKRHLLTTFDLSPSEYREKWNLPADYPMVAPNYAATRSALAKANGLGRKPPPKAPVRKSRKTAASAPATASR